MSKNQKRLNVSDILKDPDAKLDVGKLDFSDPRVVAVIEGNKKAMAELREQIKRNNSREGLDKEITI